MSKPGVGPDRGGDVVALNMASHPTGREEPKRYLIQCKHNAHSGKTVNDRDAGQFSLMPAKFEVDGWLLVTSTRITQSLVDNINAACESNTQYEYDHWDANKLEKFLLQEESRPILKQYFPESYAKLSNIIAPTVFETNELLKYCLKQYKELSELFYINEEMESIVHAYLLSDRRSFSKISKSLQSKAIVDEYLALWKKNFKKDQITGGIIILFEGVNRLVELKGKGLPDDVISDIMVSEMNLWAFTREMNRKSWEKFTIHKGKDYNWKTIEINQHQSFIPPIACGFKLVICCDKPGDAAAGTIRINKNSQELKFIAGFNVETNLDIIEDSLKLELPYHFEYKLEEGSDHVVFLSVGYAMVEGLLPNGKPMVSWVILA